jgi:two-component sensor histidine kinase
VPPGCQVRFHIADHAVEITGRQATLLAVLITEMIANAMRHGLRDRDQGDIWIKGRVEGADVIVEIEDNGQGLPDDFVLERETGLGLQITRTLMGVDLGGRLAITNRPEGGTRVTLQFPFRARTGGASQD